jgi:NCAIR mutase (PurE)-related protein
MNLDRRQLTDLANQLQQGTLPLERFLDTLAPPLTADVGHARVDLDRRRRCGFPEVVYGPGKSVAALEQIFQALLADGVEVLATRVSAEQAASLAPLFPAGRYHAVARTFRLGGPATRPETVGYVPVVTAGTSDLPIAEEARETLDWMNVRTTVVHDVGVAGPHRLPERLNLLAGADAIVVVAGMEGALPSVVGGYVDCPVVAVPTSVGYGMSLGGIAALLSMLNSCAANVTVVNVDAGFKAGYVAGLIASRAARRPTS